MLYIGQFDMWADKCRVVKHYFDPNRNKNIYRWYDKWDHETDETVKVSKFKRITSDYADDLDQKLAILHTPICAVGEIAGLADTIQYDLLAVIEYYLRAMYPCVRDIAPSPLDRFSSNFDVTNIEKFIDYDYPYTDCYRGVYHNGEEIIIYININKFWCNINGIINRLSGIYKRIVAGRLGIKFFAKIEV